MRFVVYGMARDKVISLIRSSAPEGTTVEARSDFQAANDIKTGQADVAIGVCQSGAGGALAVSRALLGPAAVAQLSTPSRRPTPEDIQAAVAEDRKVFGFAVSHIEASIPELVKALGES